MIGIFSDERSGIIKVLGKRAWFQATPSPLQQLLLSLPENHNGFLRDLAQRPEAMGGVTVISLASLAQGNFALIPIFNVVNAQGTEFTYEYVSWRHGPMSGAKGLVFVEKDGEITHFILLRGEKFSTAKLEWDCVGGFIEISENGIETALNRFKTELEEELGMPGIVIKRVVDLGELAVDAGMTTNRPKLMAAVIDGSEANRLSENPVNPDQYELRAGTVVFPISQLPEVVRENSDSFFLSCITRAIVAGLIPASALMYK